MNSENHFWDLAIQADQPKIPSTKPSTKKSILESLDFTKLTIAILIIVVGLVTLLNDLAPIEEELKKSISLTIGSIAVSIIALLLAIRAIKDKINQQKQLMIELAERRNWKTSTQVTKYEFAQSLQETAPELFPDMNPRTSYMTARVFGKLQNNKEEFFAGKLKYTISYGKNHRTQKRFLTVIKCTEKIQQKLVIKTKDFSIKMIFNSIKNLKKTNGSFDQSFEFYDLYELIVDEQVIGKKTAQKIIPNNVEQELLQFAKEKKSYEILFNQNHFIISQNGNWDALRTKDHYALEKMLNENFKLYQKIKESYLRFLEIDSTTDSI